MPSCFVLPTLIRSSPLKGYLRSEPVVAAVAPAAAAAAEPRRSVRLRQIGAVYYGPYY
eukprot:COSAG05_NODE_599_length_8442_cov_52.187268_9_plen_58_part_00